MNKHLQIHTTRSQDINKNRKEYPVPPRPCPVHNSLLQSRDATQNDSSSHFHLSPTFHPFPNPFQQVSLNENPKFERLSKPQTLLTYHSGHPGTWDPRVVFYTGKQQPRIPRVARVPAQLPSLVELMLFTPEAWAVQPSSGQRPAGVEASGAQTCTLTPPGAPPRTPHLPATTHFCSFRNSVALGTTMTPGTPGRPSLELGVMTDGRGRGFGGKGRSLPAWGCWRLTERQGAAGRGG